jgi:hypothetical protein
MTKTKFTDQEIDLIQEMIDFPSAYRLMPKGQKAVKSILEKMKTINKQN